MLLASRDSETVVHPSASAVFSTRSHKERIDEIIGMTAAVNLFDRIDSTHIRAIAEHMHPLQLDAGQWLFAEGETGDYVCFVVSGTLEAFKESQNGKLVSVSTMSRGRSIGEMALVDALPRSATIIAKSPCTLLALTRDSFEQILEERPRAGVAFMQALSRSLSLNLRRTSGLLADMREPGSADRVAEEPAEKHQRLIPQLFGRKSSLFASLIPQKVSVSRAPARS